MVIYPLRIWERGLGGVIAMQIRRYHFSTNFRKSLSENLITGRVSIGIARRYDMLPTLTHIHEIDEDPDILVVGFQELDLSAGALLYSAETLREDAWTSAVFAGLGEKIGLYDKVSRDGYFSVNANEVLSILPLSGSCSQNNWSECSSWHLSRRA